MPDNAPLKTDALANRYDCHDALRRLVALSTIQTDSAFFPACVQSLAEVLRVGYSFILEFTDVERTRLRSRSFWANGSLAANVELARADVPCPTNVRQLCFYRDRFLEHFPEWQSVFPEAVSYLAVPLATVAGEPLGYLAIADTQPMVEDEPRAMILQLVATQVASELERQLMARSLQAARAEAEAANRAKTAFLASISHELRTPLNAIIGFTQLLEGGTNLFPQQRQQLGIIHRSGSQLSSLVNGVLEMTRLEAGQAVLEPRPFDLYRLLQRLYEKFYLRASEKRLPLQFCPAPDLPQYLEGDEEKLQQVLIQLIGNAIKFTQTGGIWVNIGATLQAKAPGYTLRFEVQDTGPGIPTAEHQSIFQPFAQTTNGLQLGGTGLGLAMSRQYVQLMGGSLEVASEPGAGACFSFSLTAAPATPIAVLASQQTMRLVQPLATNPIGATVEELSCMSETWRLALWQAAVQVDSEQILALLMQIPPEQSALADRLRTLTLQFRFDEILELIAEDEPYDSYDSYDLDEPFPPFDPFD
ncbi:hypothetical protein IQ241_03050 [Romeria aff. gracilis LEGE 07310]|uniref:histidine kinase n=1 Tax=Vasconcelosia minhoensis LEGE 07310 TaxID=915328 RepID=A0A8J7DAC9_9CYAN|nr:GAF domain-containing protein [Romeria gracilis]MBE9076282.1 hypothetical protein [Romeria aff. gracilis LEGE 07310]